jgi:hypothetical protein
MSPLIVARLLKHDRFVAVIADSLLNFFYANGLSIKRLPVELQSPSFNVAVVTIKGRTVSPVAQLFTEQAQRIGDQLTKSRNGGYRVHALPIELRADAARPLARRGRRCDVRRR